MLEGLSGTVVEPVTHLRVSVLILFWCNFETYLVANFNVNNKNSIISACTYIFQVKMICGHSLHNLFVHFCDLISQEQVTVQMLYCSRVNLEKILRDQSHIHAHVVGQL